jgi:hypothetical protein
MKLRGMKRYRTCYANWTMREYGVMARCLLTGRIRQGPYVDSLSQHLSALYTPSAVFLLNYAHHGIGMALSWFQCNDPAEPAQVTLLI